jgi:hypothetical protein
MKNNLRRPSTSKRVLRAVEGALNAVDPLTLDQTARGDHKIAVRWLKAVRRYNHKQLVVNNYWSLKKLREEKEDASKL